MPCDNDYVHNIETENRKWNKIIKNKNEAIKNLNNLLKPKNTIEEELNKLIYKFNLVPNSTYFKREAAARIMTASVKLCKQLDSKWKNIPESEFEELSNLNHTSNLDDLYNSKVYLKLKSEYYKTQK